MADLGIIFIMGDRYPIQLSDQSSYICWLEQSPENGLYRPFRYFWATLYIGFPAHFVISSFSFRKWAFNFVPDTLECMNVRKLVSISSLVDQFWNIVIKFRALSPIFVNCNSNSSVTVAEHETAKTISTIGIHFRQSFNQIRLPGV